MNLSGFKKLSGKVARGHQIASGQAQDSPYPDGSIHLQLPYFKERGLDLSGYYLATLNVDVSPIICNYITADHTFTQVNWIASIPPETFSFSRCMLEFQKTHFESWIYYPHPETKVQHFQSNTLLEIITTHIPEIDYDSEVNLYINPKHFQLIKAL